ncbi:MAG: hypothetical protein DLM73_13250 [Chthoniobacterales bacterium]|nr:MAG: hypothetical protein DLM73_13250 [Chthoniobacterales bacterium]
MKKNLIALLATIILAGMICSCSKSPPQPAANSTPDPKLPDRVEKQQRAMAKASEELKKRQENASPTEAATPTPTSTP